MCRASAWSRPPGFAKMSSSAVVLGYGAIAADGKALGSGQVALFSIGLITVNGKKLEADMAMWNGTEWVTARASQRQFAGWFLRSTTVFAG